ncbi:MAG: Mur ligase family protein [Oscillospiraceae bacterium]|nr:Mur ligase family protein [Oscillospiraceae bacterium]
MLNKLHDFFAGKNVLLLGLGLEGSSTLQLLEKLNCAKSVMVWEEYHHTRGTKFPPEYDIIMKSPGIPLYEKIGEFDPRITGQADLFLRFVNREKNPVIGITGTKGKSTTSSLVHHILNECRVNSRLIGNIGVPPLDVAEDLTPGEVVVMELSCHQLEYVQASPEYAVLLNIYEDHLDHYIDFKHYKHAKENIFRFQKPSDVEIRVENTSCFSREINSIEPEKARIRGKHNIHNMAVALRTVLMLGLRIPPEQQLEAAYSFGGLEHRLELFAEIDGVKWVNDSISTIPEAAIAAMEAFPEADTIIIGGLDRGVDYSVLIDFLKNRPDINVVALPDSGHKIADLLGKRTNIYKACDLAKAVEHAKIVTKACCVLSPAAASYGFYKNFEERGRHFKELI